MAAIGTAAKCGERGQALVEMALTLPLLLLVLLGIFDFGLMLQKYGVVTNAAREGARVGVLGDYTPPGAADSPLARSRALDYMAVGGLTGSPRGSVVSCDGSMVVGAPCASAVVTTTTITGSSPPKTVKQIVVTATLDYEHRFVGPIIGLFGGAMETTRLTSISTMRME